MNDKINLGVVGIGVVGLLLSTSGIYLLWLRHQVDIGKKAPDEGTYKALSRYPLGDWGKHWEKAGDPSMVTLIGVLLSLIGLGQLIGVFAYAGQYIFGFDLGFP